MDIVEKLRVFGGEPDNGSAYHEAADEILRLRKDAERYRFLRVSDGRHAELWAKLNELACTDELMDEAVDDAMAKTHNA
ncbi:MAG: hypothetical protein EG825_16120 [Rhodocyclaceae bacterium]|nr:hypothetical protein [Rhodocyclaceae bacterium]